MQDLSLFAQDDINIGRDLTLNLGVRYQHQFWPDIGYTLKGVGDYTFPSEHNVAPRLAAAWTPWGRRQLSVHGSYGIFYDNHLTSLSGVTDIVDGSSDGVRTLVRQLPQSFVPWNSPGHKLPEASAGTFPSLVIAVDPTLETPYAHHASGGVRYEFPRGFRLETDVIYVRGFNQVGTLDYNPIIPELGTGRRPEDLVVGGVPAAGTSASVLQYTTFGETWYKGLTVSVAKNVARSRFQAVYTLSKAEDTSTDYQNAFIPQDTGKGRNPDDPTGLPIGFDPRSEKGPSLQDQRHRFVFNAIQTLPKDFQVSGIVAIGSGRPYNILAGTDLNGDGTGGAFPPDRARENPADPTSSVGRNTGILPSTASVDIRVSRVFRMGRNNLTATGEVFNLFNRTNYTEINNIFGRNPFPESPDSTYGQFEKAGPPLQAQLGLRLQF